MIRTATATLALVLVAGPAAAGPRDKHVLVHADGWLQAAPKAGAVRARLASERSAGALLPFRLVSEQKGWLTVETLDEVDPAVDCYAPIAALTDYKLRFAVRAADRAQVTGKAVSVSFADGSTVALHAGVALEPSEAGRFQITVGDVSLDAALPAGAAATAYRTEAVTPDHLFDRVLAGGKAPTVDGRELTVRGRRSAEDAGDGKVRIATRCAEIVALGKSVLPAMTGGGAGPKTPLDLVGINHYVPGGRPVLFADGKPAGTTRRDLSVDDFGATGKLLCKTIALAPGEGDAAAERSLTLCVRPKDVKQDDSKGQIDGVVGGGNSP